MTIRDILLSEDPVSTLWYMDLEELCSIEPSLADLRMDMSTFMHKDNLVHSIKVLQNGLVLEEEKDIILRTALLFHDIGKPATRDKDEKGNVTFHNHDAVGAKMIREILPKHGYSKDEICDIFNLVELHMRVYGFNEKDFSDSGIRRIMNDCTSFKNFERLLILFRSDLTTSNNKLRNKILRGILKFENKARKIKAQDFKKSLRPLVNGNDVMKIYGLNSQDESFRNIMKVLYSDKGLGMTLDEIHSFIKLELDK